MIDVNLIDGEMSYYKQLRIKDGKFTQKFGSDLMQWVSTQPDKEVELTVKELEISKTNDQLSYIHALIKIFSSEQGYTTMQSKLACKEITGYFEAVTNVIRGGTSIQYKSFGDASLKELSRICDEFYTYLTVDVGLNVPDSEEWKKMTPEQRAKHTY